MKKYYAHQYRLNIPLDYAYLAGKYRLYFLLALLFSLVSGLYLADATLKAYRKELPDVEKLRAYEPALTTRIFSSDGQLIGTLFRENRTWVPFKKMSPWLPKALVAVEDSRFYEHSGVDPIGILRAAVVDLRHKGAHEGASTITMQLARNMFFTQERTLDRKFREALVATEIEKKFSKDQILEFYLNQIYLGSGCYGVQSAAGLYFGCDVGQLTPAQAALLAGLPQAPSRYSPFVDATACRTRQSEVLTKMYNQGFLDWDQYRNALEESRRMRFKRRPGRQEILKVPYFTSYVIKELSRRYTEDQLYRGGLDIYTSVDLKLQKSAEDTVNQMVTNDERTLNVHQAAVVTIDNQTGYVRAMVGGKGFNPHSQFNRAWQSRRQAGSSFKPFVYTTALEAGYTPLTIMDDAPAKFETSDGQFWEPKNSDGKSLGKIPLWMALQRSRNVVSARLVAALSPQRVVEMAERVGIDKLTPSLSLALGTAEVSPLQMASAYTIFPNSGVQVQPTFILRVIDSKGNTLEDNRFGIRRMVITEQKARTMVWMMQRVVNFGTGYLAQVPGHPVGGKTGTTDSNRDAWFVGYTPQFTTAVWTGNDDYSRMWGAQGGDLPARIFSRVMTAASQGQPQASFPTVGKEPLVRVDVCQETNVRCTPFCPKRYAVMMDPTFVTDDRCPKHTHPPDADEDDQDESAGNTTSANTTKPAPEYKFTEAPEPKATATPSITDDSDKAENRDNNQEAPNE